MNSLTGSSDRIRIQTKVPPRHRSPRKLIGLFLPRRSSAEVGLLDSGKPTASVPRTALFETRGSSFVPALPRSVSNDADANRVEDDDPVASTYSSVRAIRITAREAIARLERASQEIEAKLKNSAREFEKGRDSIVAAEAADLRKLREAMGRGLAAEVDTAFQSALSRSNQQLEAESAAILANLDQQVKRREDVVVEELQERFAREKQRFLEQAQIAFGKLHGSTEQYLEDTRQRVAASVQESLDGLTKSSEETARVRLEALRENFVSESQREVKSAFRFWLEMLAKEVIQNLVERANAELAASRQAFIESVQNERDKVRQETTEQLHSEASQAVERASASLCAANQRMVEQEHARIAGIARDSLNERLESEVVSAVERGRQNLRNMVDSFLAKAVPQIQAELEKLVGRHMEKRIEELVTGFEEAAADFKQTWQDKVASLTNSRYKQASAASSSSAVRDR